MKDPKAPIDLDRLRNLLDQALASSDANMCAVKALIGTTSWSTLIPDRFRIDPGDPATWPMLLRESDICRDPKRNYPGLVPLTRSAFRDAIADGYIVAPVKLGGKVVAWRKADILQIAMQGVGRRRRDLLLVARPRAAV